MARPLDVLNRVASLNASNLVTELVNDVNTRGQAASDNKVSVSSDLETVRGTLKSLEDDTLAGDDGVLVGALTGDVLGKDVTSTSAVELNEERIVIKVSSAMSGDRAVALKAGVGDEEGLAVLRELDTVRVLKASVHDLDLAGGRTVAVGGQLQLLRGVGDAHNVGVVSVSEPDVANGVNDEIVRTGKVKAKVVVDEPFSLKGLGVDTGKTSMLLLSVG